jgi:hypothetical protein
MSLQVADFVRKSAMNWAKLEQPTKFELRFGELRSASGATADSMREPGVAKCHLQK